MSYELLQKGRTVSYFKKLDLKYVWQLLPSVSSVPLLKFSLEYFVFPPIVRTTQKKA